MLLYINRSLPLSLIAASIYAVGTKAFCLQHNRAVAVAIQSTAQVFEESNPIQPVPLHGVCYRVNRLFSQQRDRDTDAAAAVNEATATTTSATTAITTTAASMGTGLQPSIVRSDSELSALLEDMPEEEKYSILLQSYCKNILEGPKQQQQQQQQQQLKQDSSTTTATATLNKMQSLFLELVQRSKGNTATAATAAVDERAVQSLVDASAFFCSAPTITTAMRLCKAGNSARAFGLANGLLTTPTTAATATAATAVAVPSDDREREVFLAAVAASSALLLLLLQLLSLLPLQQQQQDAAAVSVQVWANLYSTLLLAAASADVFFRQGRALRDAAAGVERLVLADEQRQFHCDGAAFLVGYLLGLPCFCFRPDALEALQLLQQHPDCLDAYKQPAARKLSSSSSSSSDSNGNSNGSKSDGISNGKNGGVFDFGGLFTSKSSGKQSINSDGVRSSLDRLRSSSGNGNISPSAAADVAAAASERDLSLGRLLIWLMAPVAAEQLKYGKTVVSDPRKAQRVLDVLKNSASSNRNSNNIMSKNFYKASSSNGSGSNSIDSDVQEITTVPSSAADQQALLQWAYFEASTLVRQYGDLLEEVRLYMDTGTSTVGECVLMIEEELR